MSSHLTSERALDSITASLGLPAPALPRAEEMGEPVEDGAAASSSSFSSRSSSSGADEGALQEPLRGYGARAPPVAGVVKPIPRRLWAAVRARAPRLRYACENAAGEFVAWTRQGGAPRALLVVSVSRATDDPSRC